VASLNIEIKIFDAGVTSFQAEFCTKFSKIATLNLTLYISIILLLASVSKYITCDQWKKYNWRINFGKVV